MKQKLYFLAIFLSGFMPLFSMDYSAKELQLAEEFRQFVENERNVRWFRRRMAEKMFDADKFKENCARIALERQAAAALQPVIPVPSKKNNKPNLRIQTSGLEFGLPSTNLPSRYADAQAQSILDKIQAVLDLSLLDTSKCTSAQPAGMLCRTATVTRLAKFKKKIGFGAPEGSSPVKLESSPVVSDRKTGISTVQEPTPGFENVVTPVMVESPK